VHPRLPAGRGNRRAEPHRLLQSSMISLPSLRVQAASLLVSAVSAVGGCKSAAPAESPGPVERAALVAQSCPELASIDEPVDPTNARVFVEVVEVSGKDLPTPIGHWLDEHIVQVRSAANLVAFPGVPTSMPWGQCVDSVCGDAQRSVSVTAGLPERTNQPIELAVRIEERLNEGEAPKVLLDTTVRPRHQEPVVLPTTPGVSTGSVIVTAYLLRKHDDLQRVMTCTARQHEREKAH
jgi:hypothetical protein